MTAPFRPGHAYVDIVAKHEQLVEELPTPEFDHRSTEVWLTERYSPTHVPTGHQIRLQNCRLCLEPWPF